VSQGLSFGGARRDEIWLWSHGIFARKGFLDLIKPHLRGIGFAVHANSKQYEKTTV
jgi:hypothetical protein